MTEIVVLKNQRCFTRYNANDEYLGSICVGQHLDGMWAYLLYVVPSERNKGVGESLIEHLKTFQRPIYLQPESMCSCSPTLEQLIPWYKKLGFKQVDESSIYKYEPQS